MTESTCRVAIADDDKMLRFALRAMLEADGRFEIVIEAADGPQATRLVDQVCAGNGHVADVLVLDMNMPGFDGYAAAHRIERWGRAIKIVVYSGDDRDIVRTKLGDIPHAFVQKGKPEHLLEELANACSSED